MIPSSLGGTGPPSVSVVVPTRDRPELLRRALVSIAAQQYEGRMEVIVVFDQAEPNIPPLKSPDNVTIRELSNTRAPGLAGARNTGILAAQGDFIAFCDDDDEWLPGKLRAQVALMEESGAVTVSCGIRVRYEGREIERVPSSRTIAFRDLLRSRRMELHPSTIVVNRQALIGTIGLVDEAIPGSYAEDYEWLLRAARVESIAAVRAPLARIYWHDSSFFAARWDTIVSALTYLLDRYPEFQMERAGLARLYGQLAFAYAGCHRRSEARTWARRALRLSPLQPRAYLALAVSVGVVDPDRVLRIAHTFGRGI